MKQKGKLRKDEKALGWRSFEYFCWVELKVIKIKVEEIIRFEWSDGHKKVTIRVL